MAIQFSPEEILETIRMVQMENLDIRTITMGISLRDCADPSLEAAAKKAYEKICRRAERLVAVGDEIEREYGIPDHQQARLGDADRARRGSVATPTTTCCSRSISIARPRKSA